MRFLLDTNAVSALMKGDAEFLRRLRAVPKHDVALPQPVIAEIEFGLARLPSSRRKALLEERFAIVKNEVPRAPWTDEVSASFGELKAKLARRGTPREDFDVAIAAHAVAAGATLVTADADHDGIPGLSTVRWSSSAR